MIMNEKKFKVGDKVMVLDLGLKMLYETMKKFDPNTKPNNLGWVEEILDDNETIIVTFPIGDDDPNEHSQSAPYPINSIVKKDW